MKLSVYMQKVRLDDERLAVTVGVSRATISRLRREKVSPSLDVAARIARATGGKVTPNDFMLAVSREDAA